MLIHLIFNQFTNINHLMKKTSCVVALKQCLRYMYIEYNSICEKVGMQLLLSLKRKRNTKGTVTLYTQKRNRYHRGHKGIQLYNSQLFLFSERNFLLEIGTQNVYLKHCTLTKKIKNQYKKSKFKIFNMVCPRF